MSTRKIKRYGWKPDLPDHRDLKLELSEEKPTNSTFPKVASLRNQMPGPYDQLQLGSCTGNSIAGAVEFQEIMQYKDKGTPSRLFIYYNERVIENTVDQDAGAEIRDGLKVVGTLGAPPETDWPYSDANPGPFQEKPPAQAYTDAKQHVAVKYYRIKQAIWDLQWCIVHHYPVVFGFTVYDSFESDAVANSGIMPMPSSSEHVVGGHAVLAVGYDENRRLVEVRNSWGPDWGDHGYFWMPYDYYTDPNLCSDFWTIRKES